MWTEGGASPLDRLFWFRFNALLTRRYERAKHVVHKCLVTSAIGLEPLEHVVVDTDIDMIFRGRDFRLLLGSNRVPGERHRRRQGPKLQVSSLSPHQPSANRSGPRLAQSFL